MDALKAYDREILYNEVWAEPVTTVAKRYGVSDVALHKVCRKLNVPLPPRGYWARKHAEQEVGKPPLPPTDGPETIIRQVIPTAPKQESSTRSVDRLSFLMDGDRDEVLRICDTIVVKDRLLNPHPLIRQDQEARQDAKREEREQERMRLRSDWYVSVPTSYPWKRMLEINVQSEELSRAYRLLDAVFKAIENLGGNIRLNQQTNHTEFVVHGEPMRVRLQSKDGNFHLMIDEYHAPRKNWRDGKRRQLETGLGSFIEGLYECAHALGTLREERQREEERRRVLEQQQRERAEKQQAELERYRKLENTALDWQKARTLEAYIAELERRTQDEPDEAKRSDMLAYIAWAKDKVAWLDPLVAKEDPILGKRKHGKSEDGKADLEPSYRRFW